MWWVRERFNFKAVYKLHFWGFSSCGLANEIFEQMGVEFVIAELVTGELQT